MPAIALVLTKKNIVVGYISNCILNYNVILFHFVQEWIDECGKLHAINLLQKDDSLNILKMNANFCWMGWRHLFFF